VADSYDTSPKKDAMPTPMTVRFSHAPLDLTLPSPVLHVHRVFHPTTAATTAASNADGVQQRRR
jgi:hypothetical protein